MSGGSLPIGVIPWVGPAFDLGLADEMRGQARAALEATAARPQSV